MTASLNFNLPEERTEHLMAVHGAEAFSALWDVDRICRDVIKYGTDQSANGLADRIRSEIRDALARVEQ